MHMPRAAVLVGILALSVGCDDEPPTPSGDLRRPSGMDYIPRGAERADIVIADAEAGGVRVLQLRRSENSAGELEDRETFVPGPVVFFKLVIPAPDFSTEVSASEDGDRVYALSSVSGQLHLLDVREAEFDVSATEADTFYALEVFELGELVDETAIPVDLEVFSRDGRDVVAIVFDRLGEDDAILAAVTIDSSGDTFSIASVETTTVARSPRDLSMRVAGGRSLLVASAVEDFVSQVSINDEGAAAIFGPHRSLDAGGPTIGIVDAGEAGAVALRLDEPEAIVFDVEDGTLVRSQRTIETTQPGSEGGGGAGRVRLPDRAVSGAHQTLDHLPNLAGENLFTESDLVDGLGDAVMITGIDGSAVFLYGRPLRFAVGGPSRLFRFNLARADGDVRVRGCESRASVCSAPLGDGIVSVSAPLLEQGTSAPECDPGLITRASSPLRYVRARYEGSLFRESDVLIEPLLTSTTGFEVAMTGPSTLALAEPGDRVLIQTKFPEACGVPAFEYVGTGDVRRADGGRLTVVFPPRDAIADLRACAGSVFYPILDTVAFVPGEFVVYDLVVGRDAALADRRRVPITVTATGSAVTFPEPISVTLTSSQGFSCELKPIAGSECTSDSRCLGRRCLFDAESTCATGTCDAGCEPGRTDCVEGAVARVCSGFEANYGGAPSVGAVRIGLDLENGLRAQLPDETIGAPLRDAWMVSFPGSRSIGEVRIRAMDVISRNID